MNEKEKAVIDEVERWFNERGRHHTGQCETAIDGSLCPFCRIAAAVRALQEPEPVRPETVEPGTQFSFKGGTIVYTVVRDETTRTNRFLDCVLVRSFQPVDLVIPIKEGSEE